MIYMTFRDAINDYMATNGLGLPFSEALPEGFEDMPADVVSTALQNFAESAPMNVADTLSPVVSQLSSVPLEPGEVEGAEEIAAILDDGGDVFEVLDNANFDTTDLVASLDDGEVPDFFDLGDVDFNEVAEQGLGQLEELADDLDTPTFGEGDDLVEELEVVDSLPLPDSEDLEEVASEAPAALEDLSEGIEEFDAVDADVLSTLTDVQSPADDGEVPPGFDDVE